MLRASREVKAKPLPALMSTWPAPAAPSAFHTGRAEGGVRERSPLALDFLHGLVLPQAACPRAGCVVPAGALEHGGRGNRAENGEPGPWWPGVQGLLALSVAAPPARKCSRRRRQGDCPGGLTAQRDNRLDLPRSTFS